MTSSTGGAVTSLAYRSRDGPETAPSGERLEAGSGAEPGWTGRGLTSAAAADRASRSRAS